MCGCNEEIGTVASDVTWDGNKLTCGSVVIKPCDKMDTVITKIFNMACNRGIVYYETDALAGVNPVAIAAVIPGFTYTVPAGILDAEYLVEFSCNANLPGTIVVAFATVEIQIRKNSLVVDALTHRLAYNQAANDIGVDLSTKIKFTASTGDIITPWVVGDTYTESINNGVMIITKIS